MTTVRSSGRQRPRHPVDTEPKTGLSGVEVVLTKLHAGAKFGNSSYNAVGGLHGVGSSVVNALSARLDIEVDRDGKTHHLAFHQGHPGVYTDADPRTPRRTRRSNARARTRRPNWRHRQGQPEDHGHAHPLLGRPRDLNDTAEFSYEQLIDRVRQTSFLVPGLRITVIDENIPETGDESVDEVREIDEAVSAEGDAGTAEAAPTPGLEGFSTVATEVGRGGTRAVGACNARPRPCPRGGVPPLPAASRTSSTSCPKGEAVSDIWRITGEDTYEERPRPLTTTATCTRGRSPAPAAWTSPCGGSTDTTPRCAGFVNVVETPGGGMHVDGFLNGITKQIRKAVEDNARKLKVNLKDGAMRVERGRYPGRPGRRGHRAHRRTAVPRPDQGRARHRAGQADRHPHDRQAVRRNDHRLQARLQGTIRAACWRRSSGDARPHPGA